MDKLLLLEAMKAYSLTCGARAHRAKLVGDPGWEEHARKGAELEEMIGQIKRGELTLLEQQVMEL